MLLAGVSVAFAALSPAQLSPVDDGILKQHKEVLQKGRQGARKTTIASTVVWFHS